MDEDTYRVEIFEKETDECEAVIGEHLRLERALTRKNIGLTRVNEDYSVRVINERSGVVLR